MKIPSTFLLLHYPLNWLLSAHTFHLRGFNWTVNVELYYSRVLVCPFFELHADFLHVHLFCHILAPPTKGASFTGFILTFVGL